MLHNRKTEIKWGLIFVAMQILWMAMENLVGLHGEHIDQHSIYTNFIAFPAFAIYILALQEKRKKDFGGLMTYRQGLISGLIITAVVMVLSPVVQWLFSYVISPDFFANAIAYAVESGKMTREDAEAYFNFNSYLVQVIIGTPVMGIFTSLIVALVTRKSKGPEIKL